MAIGLPGATRIKTKTTIATPMRVTIMEASLTIIGFNIKQGLSQKHRRSKMDRRD